MNKKNLLLCLAGMTLLAACGQENNEPSSSEEIPLSSSIENTSSENSSSEALSSEIQSSSDLVSSSTLSSSEEILSSSEEEIVLPGDESSSEGGSNQKIGEHKLTIIAPETVTWNVFAYVEYDDSEDGETHWTYGEEMDLDENLAPGYYLLYVTDAEGDDSYCYIEDQQFDGNGITFYALTGVFFQFEWKDLKDVTVDITSHVTNIKETGQEEYIGSYTVYGLDGDYTVPHSLVITSTTATFDEEAPVYVTKNTDTSIGIGIWGGARYYNGFLYLLDANGENFYLGHKNDVSFSINYLWEGVYNSSSHIIDCTVGEENVLFYHRGSEIKSTQQTLRVTKWVGGDNLATSTEVYLADSDRFEMHGRYHEAVRFYIQDQNALNPRSDRHYFNFQQGGEEAGTYSLAGGNADSPKLVLDGFGACAYGEEEGTYRADKMYVTNANGVSVAQFTITVMIPGQPQAKYILNQEAMTYKVDTTIDYDPFATASTYQDTSGRYFKFVFQNGSVTIQDLRSVKNVTWDTRGSYTVSKGFLNADFEAKGTYDYEYSGVRFNFKIEYDAATKDYILRLNRDVTYYDEMSDYDVTLASAGLTFTRVK